VVITETYRVISSTPIVVDDGSTVISYSPGQVFTAQPKLPSIVRLLAIGSIILTAVAAGSGSELILDEQLAERYIKANGTRPWTGNQSLGGAKITNSAAPTAAADLANKAYVDLVAVGGPATQLATTGSPVTINTAAPPTTGQSLVATSATAATWQGPYIKADGTTALTADWAVGSKKLTGVTDPTLAQDAATKNYVDTHGGGDLVVVARTANTLLTAADTRKLNTNTGTAINIVITLPALVVGARHFFAVTDAFYMRIDNLNASTTITVGVAGGVQKVTVAGGFVRSNIIGSMLEIIGVSPTQWMARVTGDWNIDT